MRLLKVRVAERFAREHEELVLHRFPGGIMGFASVCDLDRMNDATEVRAGTLWQVLRSVFFQPDARQVPAVWIPSGACLKLDGIPRRLQVCWHVGPVTEVTFTRLSAAAARFREACRFQSGEYALLEEFTEGVRAKVLRLAPAKPSLRARAASFPRKREPANAINHFRRLDDRACAF